MIIAKEDLITQELVFEDESYCNKLSLNENVEGIIS
jgi:hypothetical protein